MTDLNDLDYLMLVDQPIGSVTSNAGPALTVVQIENNQLKLAAIGPIDRLIVCDEGVTPKKYHEFSNLPSGWEKTVEFKESFRCYSSSLENLRFAVDDGPEKKADGMGSGNFSWSK